MVQQVSYAQEIKGLGEKQEVAVNSSFKNLNLSWKMKVSSELGVYYNIPNLLIKKGIRRFYLQI